MWYPLETRPDNLGPRIPVIMPRLVVVGNALMSLDRVRALLEDPLRKAEVLQSLERYKLIVRERRKSLTL